MTREFRQARPLSNGAPVTEDSVALAFAERYRDNLRFDHDAGKWFLWAGTCWQCERTGLAFSWARDLVRDLAKDEPDRVRFISSKTSFAGGVEKYTRTDRTFAVTSELWDQDGYLLGTPTGTVDLRTGVVRAAVPEDYITKLTAVGPASKSDCPRWRQFMLEVTNGDETLIGFLQRFAGYMLTGDTKEHSLLFGYGDGGNGKSVLQNTFASIMGDYAKTAAMEVFVSSSSDKHSTDLAMLHGARLVTASETEEGRAWAEAKIKQMTGGDPITARFMRRDNFTFRPQFKLLLIGNHQPTLRNIDEAARRRFNIVPFVHKPPIPDKDLETKLKAEWPAILRWMIEGCLMWQQSGLQRPQAVLDSTAEYFTAQDSVRQWIDDRCETGKPTLSDTSSNLFRSWSSWAAANGEKAGTTKWLSQALQRQGFKPHRGRKGRGFYGIEAKAEPTTPHWSDHG